MKPRKIPVGWRVLTPTEFMQEGDYWTSKNNLNDLSCWSDGTVESHNKILENPEINPSQVGLGYISANPGVKKSTYPTLLIIRRKTPKQTVTLNTQVSNNLGTEVAKTSSTD